MSNNPSDNPANQRPPTENPLQKANGAPAPEPKAEPTVNRPDDKSAASVSNKTELHIPPTEAPKPSTETLGPATVNLSESLTLPHKPVSPPEPPPVPTLLTVPPAMQSLPNEENPYILSPEVDRARLVAQSRMFRGYIETNAKRLIGENVERILDVGCGEGQLTQMLAKVYPQAKVIGIDRDAVSIEAARRASKGIVNIEYIVKDVYEGLPDGPFDLVYASMTFMHLKDRLKALQAIYQVLKPGGYLWTKDLDRAISTAFEFPTHRRMWELLETAMKRIGANLFVSDEILSMMAETGYTEVRVEGESYEWSGQSTEGRISVAVGYGAFYNTRMMLSKVMQMPEAELVQLYKTTVDQVMAPSGPKARQTFKNIIARRPQQPPANVN